MSEVFNRGEFVSGVEGTGTCSYMESTRRIEEREVVVMSRVGNWFMGYHAMISTGGGGFRHWCAVRVALLRLRYVILSSVLT